MDFLQKLQRLPFIFKKWTRDDIEREEKAYYKDTTPYPGADGRQKDDFEPERYIKSSADVELCEAVLKEQFRYI